jgi:tetratricopeptide (TPR) repeat protein
MAEPTLSLCMIVRDEQVMLPDFFSATQGLWDEFIAVDTGSTDDTVSLLEAAGAQVISYPWDDDFSAARNMSLEHAQGEWIVFLDADERISQELISEIRQTIANDQAGAATVVMRNQLPHGHHRESHLLRLFRNDPSIRFRFRIHEDVTQGVESYLARTGRQIVHLKHSVEHLGYIRDVAISRQKKSRDLRLLDLAIKDDPEDLYNHFKRVELASFWNDVELWQQAAQDALQVLERTEEEVLSKAHYGGELVVLVVQGLDFEDLTALSDWFEIWGQRIKPSADYFYFRGQLREQLGDSAGAKSDFQQCLGIGESRNIQYATVRPMMGLCRLALEASELARAEGLAHDALDHNPRDLEALLAATSIAYANGGDEGFDAFVSAHRQAYGDLSELDEVVGESALMHSDVEVALTAFQRAAGTPPAGRAALGLAKARLMTGDVEGCEALLLGLVETMPEAAIGVVVCKLCRAEPMDLTIDIDMETANSLLKDWTHVAMRCERFELAENFVGGAQAISHIFEWLPDHIQKLLDAANNP